MFVASGISRSALHTKGRRVVRKYGKQVLLIESGVGCSPSPIAVRTKAIP